MYDNRYPQAQRFCGIYCITNLYNGKRYIGQSVDIERRWKQHKETEKKGSDMSLIHKAMRKYGLNNFAFDILYLCPSYMLAEVERYYILQLGTLSTNKPGGYNVTLPSAGNTIHYPTPQEAQYIIYYLLHSQYTIKEIARGLGITEKRVIAINKGKEWRQAGLDYPLRRV